jgi:hypothetical protein
MRGIDDSTETWTAFMEGFQLGSGLGRLEAEFRWKTWTWLWPEQDRAIEESGGFARGQELGRECLQHPFGSPGMRRKGVQKRLERVGAVGKEPSPSAASL